MISTYSTRWGDSMMLDQAIDKLTLTLCEETEVPNSEAYRFHGNSETKKRPHRWQKAFDIVNEFIESDMDIASIDISDPPDCYPYPINFKHRLSNNIQTYARKQGIVAKKRGDKIYLIKDKEN